MFDFFYEKFAIHLEETKHTTIAKLMCLSRIVNNIRETRQLQACKNAELLQNEAWQIIEKFLTENYLQLQRLVGQSSLIDHLTLCKYLRHTSFMMDLMCELYCMKDISFLKTVNNDHLAITVYMSNCDKTDVNQSLKN